MQQSNHERGMTLIEVMVAVAIFSVIFISALALYQAANRAYLATDANTIQQQNVRFAMDRMAETLRNAGANYNVTGATDVPDEQIEGAWEAAIFVRGDFNNARESALEDTSHPIVTTGNNEIVGYVLRKPGGDANNPATITIKADLTPATGRDASISGTTISDEETSAQIHVATTTLAGETNPPYELTRVTFDAAGNPQYQVVADNIFRLSFSYLASSGSAMTTYGGDDGASLASRIARAGVRQIDVNLTGMSSRRDFSYSDTVVYTPPESASTKSYRKFSLAEHLVPPNLGLTGKRHVQIPAYSIDPPPTAMVCVGHCKYFHVSWQASPTAGVDTYKVHITADPGANPATDPAVDVELTTHNLFLDYVQPSPNARPFTFTVAATTDIADSAYTNPITITATEDANSTPDAPAIVAPATQAVTAAQGAGNTLDVSWNPVTTNSAALTNSNECKSSDGTSSVPTAPWSTQAPDVRYYKVYRARSTGTNNGAFAVDPTNRVDNITVGNSPALTNTTPTASGFNSVAVTFNDTTVAPCSNYFYRVQTMDLCDIAGGVTGPMASAIGFPLTDTTIVPAAPVALNGSYTFSGGNYVVTLNWPAVTKTASSQPAGTAHYIVDRYVTVSSVTTFQTSMDVYDALTKTDTVPSTISGVSAVYTYYVRAHYDCASPRDGANSPPYTTCNVTAPNTVTITTPAASTDIARPFESGFSPQLTMGGTGWTSASVTITNASGSIVYNQTISGGPSGSMYTFPNFDATSLPDGTYTLSATGSVGACSTTPVTRTFQLSTPNCGLELSGASPYSSLSPTTGPNKRYLLNFNIHNTCTAADLTISGFTFTWTGGASGAAIDRILYNGVAISATGLGKTSGQAITLTTNQTIAAGATTTGTFIAQYATSNDMHSGTDASWSSITARIQATGTDDQLLPTGVSSITP